MNISSFSLQVLLLFIPGLIAFLLVDNLTAHKPFKLVYIFIYTMILGMMSYLTLYCVLVLFSMCRGTTAEFYFWKNLTEEGLIFFLPEIIYATLVSVFLGSVVTFVINHGWFNYYCGKVGLSKKHGYSDTLSYMINLYTNAEPNVPLYLTITDWEKRLRIVGVLVALSGPEDRRDEMLLQDCTLYSLESGEEIYSIPVYYFCPDYSKITIEIDDHVDGVETEPAC